MKSDGFTLVETMVALVVLTMGALAVTHLSLGMAVVMNAAGTKTELVAQAENLVESVQMRDFASLVPGSEADTVLVRGVAYVRRVTVLAPSPRLREIRVRVEPAGPDGPGYSMMSYVAR